MDMDRILEIVDRIQNDTASEDDRIIYETWLNESEENRRLSALLMQVEYKLPENAGLIKANAFKKIQTAVREEKIVRHLSIWRYSAVASIALLIALSAIVLTFSKRYSKDEVYLETQVPYGQRTKVTLADGTVVVLNAGSSLKYPPRFLGNSRTVSLTGEAYFEVSKDKDHPFIVETEKMGVRVYGTHFNVKSFRDEDIVETTLVEGSVGLFDVTGNKELVRLKPNQKALFNKQTSSVQLQSVNASLETSWIDGRYYFKKESLVDITRKLERNFNTPIRITSPELKSRVYAGLFDKNKTLTQILDLITLHNDFTYKVKNDTIIIYSSKVKQQN